MVIGDHKGLFRGLNLFKVFAAYNMVLVHGAAILFPLLVPLGYVEQNHIRLSFLRGIFSMTLPAIAGFYFRHILGPYLRGEKLSLKLSSHFGSLFFWTFFLEALRIVFVARNVDHIFAWQVLHFIFLAVVVTYILLRVHKWLPVAVVLASYPVLKWGAPLVAEVAFTSATVSPLQLVIASWVYAGLFGLLAGLGVYLWSGKRLLSVGVLLVSGVAMQWHIADHREALVGFMNMGASAFFPLRGGGHSWSFFLFYPLFMVGYYLRTFLFERKFETYFGVTSAAVFLSSGLAFYFGIVRSSVDITQGRVLSQEAFLIHPLGVVFLSGVFYFGLVLSYFILRGERFKSWDPWLHKMGGILSLYVIHTAVFVVAKDVLVAAPEFVKKYGNLVSFYVLMHVLYVVSLILSYGVAKLTDYGMLVRARSKMNEL